MESKCAEFIKYWELAQSHPEKLNKKEYTFDNWKEISNRFHVVTSKTTHHYYTGFEKNKKIKKTKRAPLLTLGVPGDTSIVFETIHFMLNVLRI